MLRIYQSHRYQNLYENTKKFQKIYGKDLSDGLSKLLDVIDAASNAYDVYSKPQFHMHLLKADMSGIYSLSPDNKRSKWRVLSKCLDANNKWVKPNNSEKEFLKEIKLLELGELSEHYE